jgi:chromosome condensin MukBEF complex kleisin-like MukF subunit
LIRLLLAVTGTSLDEVASQLKYRRASISTASRYPETAGPRLRRSLERYFEVPWSVLAAPCDRKQAATALLHSLSKKDLNHVI